MKTVKTDDKHYVTNCEQTHEKMRAGLVSVYIVLFIVHVCFAFFFPMKTFGFLLFPFFGVFLFQFSRSRSFFMIQQFFHFSCLFTKGLASLLIRIVDRVQ